MKEAGVTRIEGRLIGYDGLFSNESIPDGWTADDLVCVAGSFFLAGEMRPLGRVTSAKFSAIDIPLARTVTRAELEARLKDKPNIAYAAAQHLKRLDAGQPLPAGIRYPVQAWTFGGELAMVFLGGEVVADYSLRLKRELGASRVWVNAYANHQPCYIPSTRILAEGGYEAQDAMDYYGLPTRLAPDVEERIVGTVLSTNHPMQKLMTHLGFALSHFAEDPSFRLATKAL